MAAGLHSKAGHHNVESITSAWVQGRESRSIFKRQNKNISIKHFLLKVKPCQPVEQSGKAIWDNKEGLGPQQWTWLQEHIGVQGSANIC